MGYFSIVYWAWVGANWFTDQMMAGAYVAYQVAIAQ